jgi:homoserine dehydrogenase
MREIGIGLLGFGTVGAGVVQILNRHGDLLASRLGTRPVLRAIADLDTKRDRGVDIGSAVLTADAGAVIEDPANQIIIELVGGTTVARQFVMKALGLGKPVVTANKALLAEYGQEIFALAAEKNTDIYFEASVGGGIPIIRALREGLIANQCKGISGILNGTCNYILTRMTREKMPFDDALREAQAKGYAEADPALDIDGHDTAHKAAILASLAYGSMVPMSAIHVEGIRGLAQSDIQCAGDLGYRIKLLAVIKGDSGGIEVRVHPALVPEQHMLASVNGVYNAIMVESDMADDTLYYGRGAGREPTASAVVGDVADLVRNLVAGSSRRVPPLSGPQGPLKIRKMSDIRTRYYLRLSLLDKPGVLAKITTVLGEHRISIASVLQKEVSVDKYVPVIIVTHQAKEREMDAALAEIVSLAVVNDKPVRLRIEE